MKIAQSALTKIHSLTGTQWGIWCLLGAALLYYLTYFNYGIDLDDEGFLLLNASAILHGQWPMADSFSYQPLSYFLLAAFFKLFGDGVFAERLLLLVLILVNVRLIYYSASHLLPMRWALLPAAVYAFAPGPWYKVFFISHILISLAATLYFAERQNAQRALLVGLTCGLAMIGRVEAGVVIAIIATVLLYLGAWKNALASGCARSLGWLIQGSRFELAFLVGVLVPVSLAVLAYWVEGKLPSLIGNVLHYYNYSDSISYVNASAGIASTFSLGKLFAPNPGEMWAWAMAMFACIVSLGWFGWALFKAEKDGAYPLTGLTIAMFGIGSLGYTYYYVWNSRMLSSFAVVYINYFFVLWLVRDKLSSAAATIKYARATTMLGGLLVFAYLQGFIKVQNYSGSYTTKMEGMVQLPNPKLANIYVYPGQDKTIADLMNLTKAATEKDYLISMSESTTLSYLSGLNNPTYYRLFLAEFAHRGEEERAIRQFDEYNIKYFVARRSQFMTGPQIGSDLASYAPKIRSYLIEKYDIAPLGEGFVLLTRKTNV